MNILKGHYARTVFSMLMAMVGVAFSILPYFALAGIINFIIQGNFEFSVFFRPVILILAGLMGKVVFHQISTISSHHLAFKIIEKQRLKLTDKLDKISMGRIEEKSSGQWTQFINEKLEKLESPIAHVIPEVFGNAVIPLVLIVIIFVIDWRIGLANMVTLLLVLISLNLMMRGYTERFENWQEAIRKMNTTIVEYIRGIKVIKAFNKSASSYAKYKEAADNNRSSVLDWYKSSSLYMAGAMEFLPASLLFVLPVSLYIFMTGDSDVSLLIISVLLSYASYGPLLKVGSHTENLATVKVIVDEINSIMAMPELERGKTRQEINSYDIKFDNVSFSYDGNKKVFENINFTIEENSLTALVGYSGSGKSTIAKLIAGFWNVDSGKIEIGGVNINDIPLEQNMEIVSYVSQDNFLFRKSILENIRMAKSDASIEEIKNVCKKASCHDFIEGLPEGYDTIAGDSGASLSGGERQRITIARALLKDAPVIVLDEATAYSDPDNEAVIQKSINELVKNKTVIMIAHRLSTVTNADKIVVLNEEGVETIGRHPDLLSESIVYGKMWNSHMSIREGQYNG